MGSETGSEFNSNSGSFWADFSSVFWLFFASVEMELEGGISLLFTGKSSTGASGARGGASEGSECAVFSRAGSVGSWGLGGVEFSSEVGFWGSSGIVYVFLLIIFI